MTESLGCRFFLSEVSRNQNTTEFSLREGEMAKTVAATMRTVFGRDLCERNGGSKHGVGKNSGSQQRSSLSPILSLVRIFPAENQNRGFEKAGGSEQESICFLFFPPEFRGEQKQKNKSAKVAIFTEFVLEDRQKKQSRIFSNFYFPISPLANFHQAMIFFSFLFFSFSHIYVDFWIFLHY
jgi:hypothetical protein